MNTVEGRISAAQKSLLQSTNTSGQIRTVMSSYRINPLGAHVDHQGGAVLAQPINQFTLLPYCTSQPSGEPVVQVQSMHPEWQSQPVEIRLADKHPFKPDDEASWARYVKAAVAAFCKQHTLTRNLDAVVDGTLIGAGLSSSASVILAYLKALEAASDVQLSEQELVELCRVVENEYMGLNNGVQDQMSIVFGSASGLALLDVNAVSASIAESPDSVTSVCWLLLYSGYSRELINSGFNTRVAECREAAGLLQEGATRLGEVERTINLNARLAALPPELGRRAKHFFTETARVEQGSELWHNGDWQRFGELMNASCQSSISDYESGSEALVTAHHLASACDGVYGSRFGGGGYGGCLIVLAERAKADSIAATLLDSYLGKFPDRDGIAKVLLAEPCNGLEVV